LERDTPSFDIGFLGDARVAVVAVAAVRSVERDFETRRPDRASDGRELLHQCGGAGLAFLGDDPRRVVAYGALAM
jgi:hypothetical protein